MSNAEASPPRPWIRAASNALTALGGLTCFATLTGFLSAVWWPFELTCHFRVQYLVTLATVAIAFGCARRFVRAGAFLVFAVLNLATIAPLYVAPDSPGGVAARATATLRVVSINLNARNDRAADVLAFVEREDPDVILLEEVTSAWRKRLGSLRRSYPNELVRTREDNFGIALFSKRKLVSSELLALGDAGVPTVQARIALEETVVTVVGTHPSIPVGSRLAALRNDQLRALASYVRDLDGPVILVGDLNVTPWSSHFSRLVEDSGFRDSVRGFGWQPTWPAQFPIFLIPIDHCLVSDELRVIDRRVGGRVGSDHLPIALDIALSSPHVKGSRN